MQHQADSDTKKVKVITYLTTRQLGHAKEAAEAEGMAFSAWIRHAVVAQLRHFDQSNERAAR